MRLREKKLLTRWISIRELLILDRPLAYLCGENCKDYVRFVARILMKILANVGNLVIIHFLLSKN